MRKILVNFMLIVIVFISGCSPYSIPFTAFPVLPESLQGNGVVVAEFQGLGRFKNIDYDIVYIKNAPTVRLAKNHLVLALPPGKYQVSSLVHGNYNDYELKNIKREFTIREGMITNLGLIVLVPEKPHRRREYKYFIYNIDNTYDIKNYLKKNCNKLLSSLNLDSIELEPGNYVKGKDLEILQGNLLKIMLYGDNKSSMLLAGPAGALATIRRDSQGNFEKYKKIRSPTMSGVKLTAENQSYNRLAFLTSERLFTIISNDVKEHDPPKVKEEKGLFLAGEKDILIIDKNFLLHLSDDGGSTWKTISDFQIDSKYKVGVVEDENGYFIYNHHPPQILYRNSITKELTKIKTPNEMFNIRDLILSDENLIVEEYIIPWTKHSDFFFYVQNRDTGNWSQRRMPNALCKPIDLLDKTGNNLRTVCEDKDVFVSSNAGQDWVKN